MTKKLTPLQADIKEALEQHPDEDDEQIARRVWSKNHPGEPYPNKEPSVVYVSGRRAVHSQEKPAAPSFNVELPTDFFNIPDEDDEPDEEADEFDPFNILSDEDTDEPTTPPPLLDVDSEDIEFLVQYPFIILGKTTGWAGWELDPRDKADAKFIKVSAKMAEKYAPDILARYGLEVMFTVSALGFGATRIKGYREYRESQASAVQQAQSQQPAKPAQPKDEPAPEENSPSEAVDQPLADPLTKVTGAEEMLRRQKQ